LADQDVPDCLDSTLSSLGWQARIDTAGPLVAGWLVTRFASTSRHRTRTTPCSRIHLTNTVALTSPRVARPATIPPSIFNSARLGLPTINRPLNLKRAIPIWGSFQSNPRPCFCNSLLIMPFARPFTISNVQLPTLSVASFVFRHTFGSRTASK
jgi:hypothetical protein